jgi:hypothetical protein
MESIYWVISRDCNQTCAHCYNHSEPGAAGLSAEEVVRCVPNLPDPADVCVNKFILSGGEVLVWPELLFHALDLLHDRYDDATRLQIQTNGDLLDAELLDAVLAHHVRRIDVSSMDKFHPKSTKQRRSYLTELFESRGMVCAEVLEGAEGDVHDAPFLYKFWGVEPGNWIGPVWPRGRALQRKVSKATPDDRFCAGWSGAKNFLNYRGEGSEVNIQLADVYPCCPMTLRPIGSLLEEPLIAMLDRSAEHPVYRALNEGRPEAMGAFMGISEEEGFHRSVALGNHCLWCDEFFRKHAPDRLAQPDRTDRETTDYAPRTPRKGPSSRA